MTKKEYMDLLSRALENVEPEVARDIMEDYEAHFERAREAGHSDEEVIAELGSIEEFKEELESFVNKEKNGEKKKTQTEKMVREDAMGAESTTNADAQEAGQENADAQEEKQENSDVQEAERENEEELEQEAKRRLEQKQAEEEERRRQQEQAAAELERACSEMNRAFEEMQRAREELERVAKESAHTKQEQENAVRREREEMERAEREARYARREQESAKRRECEARERAERERVAREAGRAAREAERAAREAGREAREARRETRKRADSYVHMGSDINSIVDSAKNIASSVLSQVSNAMDKAFSGFGDWMGSSFEKSGEDMADYRRRQENAKDEAAQYQKGQDGEKNQEGAAAYSYSYDYDDDGDEETEQYMPECRGFVTEEEGIRHLVVDSKSAEVEIRPSEDNRLFFRYTNRGSAGSKIIYRLEKRISQNTLTLSIARNERGGRGSHSSILGGVFEGDSDLKIELRLPKWLEALEVGGKSGDIEMEDVDIATLMLKNISGDVSVRHVNADKCMVETVSGDANVKDGEFGSVLATSKSGDAIARGIKAQKAALKSMSGDATAQDTDFDEAVISSMSGDASLGNGNGRIISISSMSGDAAVRDLAALDVKISSASGDVDVQRVTSDNLLMTVASGDMQGVDFSVKILKTSSASGDMSLRGHADQMNLANGSGDVIVVQNGDTKAAVTTRSGEVNFHLKNEGAGFAAKISTHGEANYRYGDLKMSDAANGIHHYGAEGSSLEIKSTSGDITITD